jgi:hypothetical protein
MIKFPHLFLYPMGSGGIFIRSCIRDLLGFTSGYTFNTETNEYFCGARLNSHLTSRDEDVIIWNNRWWEVYELSNMSKKLTHEFAETAPNTSLGNIAVHCPPKIYSNIDYSSNTQLLLTADDKTIKWCAELAIYKRQDTSKGNFRWSKLDLRKKLTDEWKKVANPIEIDFFNFYENSNIESLIEYCDCRSWKIVGDIDQVKRKISKYVVRDSSYSRYDIYTQR